MRDLTASTRSPGSGGRGAGGGGAKEEQGRRSQWERDRELRELGIEEDEEEGSCDSSLAADSPPLAGPEKPRPSSGPAAISSPSSSSRSDASLRAAEASTLQPGALPGIEETVVAVDSGDRRVYDVPVLADAPSRRDSKRSPEPERLAEGRFRRVGNRSLSPEPDGAELGGSPGWGGAGAGCGVCKRGMGARVADAVAGLFDGGSWAMLDALTLHVEVAT